VSRPSEANRARFQTVYDENREAILAYLMRRTDAPEDAADLLAEVYVVAWRRITDVPKGVHARPWLFGVARRLLANQRRRARTFTGLAAELKAGLREANLHLTSGPDTSTGVLRRALSELAPVDRELLTLTGWEGLTPAEIAVVLGRSPSRVRVQLHRARGRLKEKLDAAGARSGAPASHPVTHG
jgi:RNA polymerase sigma factor (sigma-70 family)